MSGVTTDCSFSTNKCINYIKPRIIMKVNASKSTHVKKHYLGIFG